MRIRRKSLPFRFAFSCSCCNICCVFHDLLHDSRWALNLVCRYEEDRYRFLQDKSDEDNEDEDEDEDGNHAEEKVRIRVSRHELACEGYSGRHE